MAEQQDSSQEKSEEPTSKRLDKAREEGQVARSRELNTTALLMTGAIGMMVFGPMMAKGLSELMSFSFVIQRENIFDVNYLMSHLHVSTLHVIGVVLPFLVLLFFAGLISSIFIGGLMFSSKALMPQLSRLNPLSGIKRMFSMKSLVELIKSIAKVAVVVTAAIIILNSRSNDLIALGRESAPAAMVHALWILKWAVLALAVTTIIISLIDVPFQIWDHTQKMKMTKQEVKDEYKDTEGKPEVKSRIRQLQREMAQRRMMGAIPEADVVITNPSHYAVALKYNPVQDAAPIVVAKGVDFIAEKMQEVAKAHDISIVCVPPLTRAVYYSTEINDEIPSGLYMALAQVLAYVFQLKRFSQRKGPRPKTMPDLPIPGDLRRDK